MFTGIIQEVGRVTELKRAQSIIRLTVYSPKLSGKVKTLESVAVNGACLTVVARQGKYLVFEVIPETRRRTSLSRLREQSPVNLEPGLLLSGRFNGHVVLGHVDGTGKVIRSRQKPGERILTIQVSRKLRQQIVPKGSITVDGVSLTVGSDLKPTLFSVHLIPKTLQQTTLGMRRAGDLVNIELDYVGKLVRRYLARPGITLRETGRNATAGQSPARTGRIRSRPR